MNDRVKARYALKALTLNSKRLGKVRKNDLKKIIGKVMDIKTLFTKALGIEAPWIVDDIIFDLASKTLHIHMNFERASKFFYSDPETGEEGYYNLHDTKQKTWQHMNFFNHKCFIHAKTPRIKTDAGKVRLVTTPWSGHKNGLTLLMEALIIILSRSMTVNELSKYISIDNKRIWGVLDHYVDEARKSENFSEVKKIGIDETSKKKAMTISHYLLTWMKIAPSM